MKKSIIFNFAFAIVMSIFSIPMAVAGEYEYDSEVVQVKCDGKIDNIIVNLTSIINPKDMKVLQSKIDLSYRLQVWQFPEQNPNEFMVVEKVKGNYVAIEASVEGKSANYQMQVPSWPGFSWTTQTTSFSTELALKAGFVDGKLSVDCQASLEKIKSKVKYE